LAVVEAPNQREAYLKAIKAFEIPIERQNRIVVSLGRQVHVLAASSENAF
jgi:hypothetical protein